MGKKTRIFLLSLVLIIAIFLRFYHFTTTPPGLYPDEAMDGNNASEVAATGHYQVFYPEDNGREGLYINLIALEFQLFHAPHEPWVVRLPAAIAGVLTVFGLYLLAAELFGYEVGLLAAFLLATSFWHINFSRIGFRAILSPLLLTWTAWLILKAFRAASSKMAVWYAVAAGIVYGLGFYTYIAYRISPLLLLLFIPFFRKYPGFWKRVTIFLVLAFVTAAPIGWYFAKNPSAFFGRTSEISVTSTANPLETFAVNFWKTLLEINVQGDFNWRQNISGAPELFWPVGILFLVGIALGIYWLWKERRKKNALTDAPVKSEGQTLLVFGIWFTFAWFILGALPAALSNDGIPHALRSILMVVPAVTLAALGGMWAYRMIKDHWGGRAALTLGVIALAILAFFAYYDYFIVWGENPNVPGAFNADYVTIGREINALPATTPKYVVVSACGVLARNIPVPAETTMFITNTFTTSTQMAKNVQYLIGGKNGCGGLPDQEGQIPPGTPSTTIFFID
ncbi:MAG TPA: glycosyltransferase family 39 protein [Candidatus Paceibacterota bacterium]|jgi:4-amino-4-deoxy-L-arabinose transferase-like glycosyltransferase|nr:glycosyltransferase family 39 protein [Candidatus Paceibacterota bacterium]